MHINNILGQTTKGQMIQALKALPTGLAQNIEFTVERIKSQHPQSKAQAALAMNVLLWLSHAKRPLKVSELQHAVAISPEENRMEDLTDPDFFVHYCFGLVVIDKETSIIRLVHFSVNEYLQERRSEFFPNADDILTSSCLSYMFIHQSVLDQCLESLPVANDEAPFMTYAARHWGIHASASVLLKTQEVVQLFCFRPVFHAWAKLLEIDVKKKEATDDLEAQYVNAGSSVLHAAAVYGLKYLMDEYLRKGCTLNTLDCEYATPLMLAVACGHTDILQGLLAQPYIDVHHLDIEQHTVLWYAVHRGQVQCVQILLSSDFDLDINRGKPFCLASQNVWCRPQYGEIMSLLLSRSELDPNCEYDEGNDPPWFLMAIRWEFDLLRRLLSRPDFDPWRWIPPVKLWPRFTGFMADTDYDYFLGDELSNKKAADLPAIFMLLDADERFCLPEFDMLYLMWPFVYYAFGKDIPYKDEGHTYSYEIDWMFIWDNTHWTWRNILRRSLEANHLSFYTKDSKNRGFIHSFAEKGKDEYLNVILQEGVAIDYKDKLGRTALHYAASNGHKGACDILINAGASPHSIDNDGQTILHLACSSGKLDVVNRLIELGADIHAKDSCGSTALHFASRSGEGAPIIELLLQGGLDINASDNMGLTPLNNAVLFKSPTAACTLLDMGADRNICAISGTALSNAIFTEEKTLIERLALDADLDIPDFLGRVPRSQLPLLFKDQRLGGTGQGSTELASPRVQRDITLSYLRKRLKAMLDGDNYIRTILSFRTALILLELSDEVSAQVMLEYGISPFSNVDTLYWPELCCNNCLGSYGYLYMCRPCPNVGSVLLCEGCKEPSVGHNFLQIPSEGWRHLRKGTVNAEGETFDEFLKSLSRKYCGGVEGVVLPQAPTPPLSRRSRMTWLRYINGYFVATHTKRIH
jgi:ankyrin repeat protein